VVTPVGRRPAPYRHGDRSVTWFTTRIRRRTVTILVPAVSSVQVMAPEGAGRGEHGLDMVNAPAVLDDATLVARARDGDVRAFEALVRRYQRRIYQLALRMTASTADAEDITQEVFLTAWRRLPELREDAAVVGWLYRAATNRCLNLLRARRPTSEIDESTAPTTRPDDDPARGAQNAVQRAALAAALDELPAAQRAVWLLREVHGRSYDEIAQLVDTTPQAVRGRLARARVQLAERMQPWQ
jgi:RNA polymerase sigma-70 factor (ECF subfamily)